MTALTHMQTATASAPHAMASSASVSPFAASYKQELLSLTSNDRSTISFLKGLAADQKHNTSVVLDIIVVLQQRLYEVSPSCMVETSVHMRL